MLLAHSFGPALRHPMTPAEAARLFASVAENGAARRVLLLRPAKLPGWPAAEDEVARLRAALDPVLALPGLVWNDLPDGEALAIWRRGGEAEVSVVEAAMAGSPGVAAVFDVPEDLASLQLALAVIAAEHGHAAPSVASGPPATPITLEDVVSVERVIGQVELLDRLTSMAVWSFGEGGEKTRAMQSLGLDLQGLLDVLVPGRTLAPEPRLRARLARVAHRRILAQLAASHERASGGTITVPSGSETVLSPEFARFDASLPARLRGRIMLEIPLSEAVGCVERFTEAARVAAAAEVPVCLSRIRPAHLAAIEPLASGATWLRLGGCETMEPDALREAIPPALLPRIIADDVALPATLAILRAGGVGLFAGPAAEAA